jgi:hypothetical protein
MALDLVMLDRVEATLRAVHRGQPASKIWPKGFPSKEIVERGQAVLPGQEEPSTDIPDPLNVDLGVDLQVELAVGGRISCTLYVYQFREANLRYTVRCPAGDAPVYDRHLRRLKHMGGYYVAEARFPEVERRALAFRVETLGPQEPVVVPTALRADYELLTSANTMPDFGRSFAYHESKGHAAARHIADAKRFDVLRNVLRGPNRSGRVFAALFLLGRGQASSADRQAIVRLRELTPRVTGNSGDVYGEIPIASALDEAERISPHYAE